MSSKRKTGSSNEKLFACTNCHKRCKFEDLSSSQQLCKVCRKQFPLVTCHYCRLEYHPIKSASGNSEGVRTCEHCTKDLKQYGKPSTCSICSLQSAFNGKKCTRCSHSEKKYGPPSVCEHCSKICAFPKPADVKKKVDGKTLCLLCTISYKKDQFKKKKDPNVSSSVTSSSSKRSLDPLEPDLEPLQKKLKLESSQVDFTPTLQPHPSLFTPKDASDLLTSNHILETDRLQNEISVLKKQIAQKDQALIEKDKQICQLKADASEKEREYRTKQTSQQKTHAEAVLRYQAEIRSLKAQIAKQSQKKSSSYTTDKTSGIGSVPFLTAPN